MMPCVAGKGDLQPQLDNALQDVNDMYLLLEETEKQAVRKALIEERGRFCTFITFLQPVVVSAGGRWGGRGVRCCPVGADAPPCLAERGAHHAGRDHPPAGHHRGPGGAHRRAPQAAPRQRAGQWGGAGEGGQHLGVGAGA